MTHNVTYPGWLLQQRQFDFVNEPYVEKNLDQSITWGLHFGYVQPILQDEWKIGAILTTNRKTHPKIPNYDLMNIPRDPGDTWAFNIGSGLSRQNGPATFGLDLIYEPIWSNTWADAAEPVATVSGRIIPAGGKTIDNNFTFNNWIFRVGIAREEKIFGFKLGLQFKRFGYRLEQYNKVAEFERSQSESWTEWRPSIGLSLKFPEFKIQYMLRLTTGSGRPGVVNNWRAAAMMDSADFIVAPSGSLTLQNATVQTHQVFLMIPIR
jgi:hypothetical protein